MYTRSILCIIALILWWYRFYKNIILKNERNKGNKINEKERNKPNL